MKKVQKAQREFDYLKKQLPKLKKQVAETKNNKLWHMETIIRKKVRDIRSLPYDLKDYKEVSNGYFDLLRQISERILENYNKSKRTDYKFDDVVKGNYKAYLDSGIISVLVTSHIPKIVIEEYKRLLPKNPKDEYMEARRLRRKFILHLGDTNTGKTYNALQRLKQGESGVYLAPLRILALENFEKLNSEGVACNLLTGEEEIKIPGAKHTSCTIEKLDISKNYDVAVIDEIQLLSDMQRGNAWTRAVLALLCPEIHVCGAINAKSQIIRMIEDCGDEYEVHEYTRLVPLKTQKKRVRFTDVEKGDAFISFSRKGVLNLSRFFAENGIKNSVIYGDLPPEVRRMQYAAFLSGENKILVSTDAIGMGVNLPIRRIIFTELEKYDGEQMRPLTSQEVKQIAGRAGRIGIYDVGYVASTEGDSEFIEEALSTPDFEIPYAVVAPSETILKIGILPLKEKLAIWSTTEEALPYYRKKDIRDNIIILDKLQPFRLPETIQWRLMEIPFDVHNDELLNQFLQYADEVFNQKLDRLSKPQPSARTLSAYEVYYRKINLYYSFSKTLSLPFDEQWVYEERKNASEIINSLLIN